MKIFEKYEIYDTETDEIYMTGFFDLIADRKLKAIQKQHYFAKLRMIYQDGSNG